MALVIRHPANEGGLMVAKFEEGEPTEKVLRLLIPNCKKAIAKDPVKHTCWLVEGDQVLTLPGGRFYIWDGSTVVLDN